MNARADVAAPVVVKTETPAEAPLTREAAAHIERVSIPAAAVESPFAAMVKRFARRLLRHPEVACYRCQSTDDVRPVEGFWPQDLCRRCREADEHELVKMLEGLDIEDASNEESYEHMLLCPFCEAVLGEPPPLGGWRAACRGHRRLKSGGGR